MPCHLFRRRIPQFEKLTGYCFANLGTFRRRLPWATRLNSQNQRGVKTSLSAADVPRNRLRTYRALSQIPGIDLSWGVAGACERAKLGCPDAERASMAAIAARFGHPDALEYSGEGERPTSLPPPG
jgi:hypothetical protein